MTEEKKLVKAIFNYSLETVNWSKTATNRQGGSSLKTDRSSGFQPFFRVQPSTPLEPPPNANELL